MPPSGKKAKPRARSKPAASSPASVSWNRWLARRNAIVLWFLGLLWFVAVAVYPPSTRATRLSGAILAGLLAAGLLALWWRYRFLRWGLIALYGLAALFWMLPGYESYDRLALRDQTAQALRRYEGVRYYWGGENLLGIDCSGIVRRGTIEAALTHGLRTANPWLVRKAVSLWWRDMSARDLGFGARRAVRRLVQVRSIKSFDDTNLHPGDFAVTEGGAHAMAYLGDHFWIEADPTEGKVIVVNGPMTSNPWFDRPVSILRWKFLEARRQNRATVAP